MKVLLFGVALLFSLYAPQRVSSRSGGAPAEACDNLTPSAGPHGPPQDVAVNAFPYRLNLTSLIYNGTLTYTPGATYTLTLMGVDNTTTFRGFFVQARLMSDDTTNVGTFAVASGSTNTRLSSCTPSTIGVTHNDASDKDYVMFDWTAPPAGTGSFRFGMAVVQVQTTHWADQRSMLIVEGGDGGNNGAARFTGVGFWSLMVLALAVAFKTVL